MAERTVVITHALRTPIGRFLGVFRDVPARDLGVTVVRGLLEKSGLSPEHVDETVIGNARQAGSGPNLARQIAVGAGIPQPSPAYTVNQACASGMLSMILGAESIRLGRSDVVVAGGSESMSRVPYLLDQARTGYRLGDATLIDGQYRDGFLCSLSGLLMGETAENLAEKYEISRDEQDEYAATTQNRCEAARKEDRFADEIVPVASPARRGEKVLVERDEHPRDGVTAESLSRLRPVFKKVGTVHAGNSSGITDGAAAVILMSEDAAGRHGFKPLARLGDSVTVGVDP
ncbi:MAG: acetyl-CoA C-acyltransferase, partial [Planctomycetota bacterium]|nr:acetyl-CoA C-acyltransferase [Planctomycetota bacterium]